MLFSRQIRTRVPVNPLVLVLQICHNIPELLQKRQAKYKEFHGRQGSKLNNCSNSNARKAIVQGSPAKPSDENLSYAVVTGKHETPRPFMITDETGREYRRNKRHIHHRLDLH